MRSIGILSRGISRRNAISTTIVLRLEQIRNTCCTTTPRMASLPDITATPAADQHILHDGKEFTTVKEGLAHILIPASASKVPQTTPRGETQPQSVFYNPIQQFNRDLSVLAIKAYGEEVVERKRELVEKSKRKFEVKKAKKRKREEADVGAETSRKAGKLDTTNSVAPAAHTDGVAEKAAAKEEAHGSAVLEDGISKDSAIPEEEIIAQEEVSKETSEWDIVNAAVQTESSEIPADGDQPTKLPNPIQPRFTILDALSATGLRALRYAQEIPFTTSITANDLLPAATKTIKMNAQHNQLEDKIKTVTGNALTHMYSLVGENCKDDKGRPIPSQKYDVIDLDPYGTAAPFLDAAVQAVRDDGGMLCVTCTDAGVWASNGYPEKAYSLYGGVTVKGPHSHEGGLRLILHAIASSAARYGLAIEPLLSLSIDFYARVFVRIYKSPGDVKFLAGKTMVVYNCDSGCGAWTTQMLAKNKLMPNKSGKGHFWKHVFNMAPNTGGTCAHCGMKMHMAGPMYAGPLHSPEFIQRILDGLPQVSTDTYHTTERIEGMLSVALEETISALEDDSNSPTATSKTGKHDPAALDHYPFFFIPSVLSKVIHCVTPHENALRGALRHLGFRVTRSHTKGGTIKTDAPWEIIWEVMREWARQKAPIKDGAIKENAAGWHIMGFGKKDEAGKESNSAESTGKDDKEGKSKPEVIFDEKLGMERDAKKLVRYQVNPRENWGPMNRAKG